MGAKKIIEILENEINKTSGEWVEIYEKKEFFENIITLLKERKEMAKKKRNLYGDKVIFNGERGAMLKCPGCGCYTLFSELIWKEGVARCRMGGCDWKFKITWGEEKKERILKTKPKGKEGFHPTTYSIPQGLDEEGHWKPWKQKNLKIGDIYDIETDEPGQEILFKAVFLGWRREIIKYKAKDTPDSHYYIAIFRAVSNIEVGTDYSLSITKSEEEGRKRDE